MQPSPITFLSVPLEAWLTIATIIIGPLAALLIQKHLEGLEAREDRKVMIFRNLMASRANRMSPAYVQALNGIEVEFYGETKVIEAWRSLIEQLYTSHVPAGQIRVPNRIGLLALEDFDGGLPQLRQFIFDRVPARGNVHVSPQRDLVEVIV
jgi:hypothetical protein